MEPLYLVEGDKRLTLSAEFLFETVKTLIEAGAEETFIAACRERSMTVDVPPELFELVTRSLADNPSVKTSLDAPSTMASTGADTYRKVVGL